MQLTSPVFEDAGAIPVKYTCQGESVNPELRWADGPNSPASFALIMEDPDVPRNLRPDGLYIHWMMWNIPPSVTRLPEDCGPMGVTGLATNGHIGYVGPCPPNGSHRYYFRVYALDTELTLPSTATKGELLRAMEGHILDHAELMGRFEKSK